MEKENIYLVVAYGGEWEDSWERAEKAFRSQESAQSYIDKQIALYNNVSEETWRDVCELVSQNEYDIEYDFFDMVHGGLMEGKSREDYDKAIKVFHEQTKYELVKDRFGITKEEYDIKDCNSQNDFSGYYIQEVELIC
jgi:hypothetical protein